MDNSDLVILRWDLAVPDPDTEREFLKWYAETHARDFLKVPGTRSVALYRCTRGKKQNPQYLSLCEVNAEGMTNVLGGPAGLAPETAAAHNGTVTTWGQAVQVRTIGGYQCLNVFNSDGR